MDFTAIIIECVVEDYCDVFHGSCLDDAGRSVRAWHFQQRQCFPHQKSYFLEFKVDKLNRILRFIGSVVVKNCTSSGLYLAVYNK